MKVKTTKSSEVWQSEDGQRKIWQVTLQDEKGTDYQLKTYSPKVGAVGWQGDVESYLNPRGDRFVRIAGEGHKGGRDETIKAEWSINQAVQIWIAQGCDPKSYKNIQDEARYFYNMIEKIVNE